MKRKKNILEEAADKVLEQYDNREFLEKIRAERGPSIIAAQKERKMYLRRTWCYTAVATLVVAMITIMCCFYAFNNDESADNNKYYDTMQYLDSSYEEVNEILDGIKINEIEQVKIIRGIFLESKETAAYFLDYANSYEYKTMRIVVDIHPEWDYKSIAMSKYNLTANIKGNTVYYYSTKSASNGKVIVNAFIQLDNVKLYIEYNQNNVEEESDFFDMLEMFIE